MNELIQSKLRQIEDDHQLKILYACESGSRAWGMASPDSDYDVRFIYVRDINWYLSLEKGKDQLPVILEGDLDIVGWDLKKVLSHIYRSNAAIHGWLMSDIVYFEEPGYQEKLREWAAAYLQPAHVVNHFLGICKSSLARGGEEDAFNLKKYLYVIRPLLGALWTIEKREIAPIHFDDLISIADGQAAVQGEIKRLLAIKKDASEQALIERSPILDAFIEKNRTYCNEQKAAMSKINRNIEPLNRFFRNQIGINSCN
jgi:predicted nucleotidyltransferase